MKKETSDKIGKMVLVTTEFRGVFAGTVKDDSKLPGELTLTDVRNCIYWSDTGGFLGMASKGVNSSCRIGAKVAELTIYKITSVSPVSDEAAATWASAKTYGE